MSTYKLACIKRSAGFLCILLITVIMLNEAYKEYVLKRTLIYRKEINYIDYIDQLDDRTIHVAVMGDSQPMAAVNPRFIPGAYNIAYVGSGYSKTFYEIKRRINEQVKINTVLLQLDVHTIRAKEGKMNIKGAWKYAWYYSKFFSLKDIREFTNNRSLPGLWIKMHFPFIGEGKDFYTVFTTPASASDIREIYLGWGSLGMLENWQFEPGKPEAERKIRRWKDRLKKNNCSGT